MADLFDYLDWRGDLSFMNSPANEADYYLISKIGCPDLTGIVLRSLKLIVHMSETTVSLLESRHLR